MHTSGWGNDKICRAILHGAGPTVVTCMRQAQGGGAGQNRNQNSPFPAWHGHSKLLNQD
jgi:hypothetical protein